MCGTGGKTDVPGLGSQLRELTRAAHELERIDASTAAWLAPLAEVNLELKEIEGRLADYSSELDCDPRELFQLEERITPVSYTHLDVYKRQA